MALSLRGSDVARAIWSTEMEAFVAGASWVSLGCARAIVHPQVPEVWDASFVAHVEEPLEAESLLYDAQALMRGAGCAHLKIFLDRPSMIGTVGAELRRLGLLERPYVTMTTRTAPPLPTVRPAVTIRPVTSLADRRAMSVVRDQVRAEAPWYSPEVCRALDTWEDIQARTLDLTWLLAFLEGEPAGAVGLLVGPRGASLQSLATAPRLRGRGVASCLIREVVVRGLARGAPRVSLLTDRDGRARPLYQRLGFEEAAEIREYLKAPC